MYVAPEMPSAYSMPYVLSFWPPAAEIRAEGEHRESSTGAELGQVLLADAVATAYAVPPYEVLVSVASEKAV